MYNLSNIPSQQYDTKCYSFNMYDNTENSRLVDYPRSPNAVTASPSPTSPRIRISDANAAHLLFDHLHEVDVKDLEAEADYREYIMYQRIMQHRSSLTNSLTGGPVLIPPTLPLSAPFNPNPLLLNHSMIQRLRDNAEDRQESFHNENDEVDSMTITEHDEDDPESEVGIFELDM